MGSRRNVKPDPLHGLRLGHQDHIPVGHLHQHQERRAEAMLKVLCHINLMRKAEMLEKGMRLTAGPARVQDGKGKDGFVACHDLPCSLRIHSGPTDVMGVDLYYHPGLRSRPLLRKAVRESVASTTILVEYLNKLDRWTEVCAGTGLIPTFVGAAMNVFENSTSRPWIDREVIEGSLVRVGEGYEDTCQILIDEVASGRREIPPAERGNWDKDSAICVLRECSTSFAAKLEDMSWRAPIFQPIDHQYHLEGLIGSTGEAGAPTAPSETDA